MNNHVEMDLIKCGDKVLEYSVEIEPPNTPFQSLESIQGMVFDEIKHYIPYTWMISITNRPVFGYSSLSTATWLQNYLLLNNRNIRVSLHLTTRLSIFDVYTQILDAHTSGVTDILPILGHPRGPMDPNYFENGFDILGFSAYLATGDIEKLTPKYRSLLHEGKLVKPIPKASFNIGSVIDINPVQITKQGRIRDIRKKQIRFAQRKEELGAKYLITQGFYNTNDYFSFIEESGISIPIIPGILPLRLRLLEIFGLPIDPLIKQNLRGQFTTEEEKIVGNKITAEIVGDLADRGCKFAHIYTMSNFRNFFEITKI